MPIPRYGDPLAEEIFLARDPIVEEVRAALWPDPAPGPFDARQEPLSERRGTYLCRLCGQRTRSCAECSAGTEDGPCEASVCLWCGSSCLEKTAEGLMLRWQCRVCGRPDRQGRCPDCQTWGAWYQVEHLVYCTVCEYRRDLRLFWGE